MFAHNKRLQYTVRVSGTNPGLANLMLEQFGGPQGELAAACRYFTQGLAEDDPGRKDLLLDIATEELSHLEVIGSMVVMLNKGAKGELSEIVDEEAEMYRKIHGAGNSSHVTQILYGGGPALTNSGGQLWNAGYIDSIGDPTADLRSNIAAEARAKIVYERLINVTDDPGVKDTLKFLMSREIAHLQSFEKALHSIQPNFPPGKAPGDPRFNTMYFNMSQGDGDLRGPWNTDTHFNYVGEPESVIPVDGDDGLAHDALDADETVVVTAMVERLSSDMETDPVTGADMGSGDAGSASAAASGATPPAATPGKRSAAAKSSAKAGKALANSFTEGVDLTGVPLPTGSTTAGAPKKVPQRKK
ncbi:manganese catalase family protein [Pigmentiphaga aceris]|uniref:Manganese catalase family protein n=1 Tax=Pigmentiphaga aceris TaxID=1940612 RepID=A0A5C0B213_9BURK|nr:manganese catalase family protein [Pigmentiphaga aceris]QEI08632.1 manganese catalase family protein [Pigmentiphaga aceris]